MKIYNRIVIDMRTYAVIEEDSFEYSGPVCELKGGGSSGSNEIKETAAEVELSKVVQAENDRYQQVYQPLFNKLSSQIQGIGQAEKNTVGGAIHAGTTKAYDKSANNTARTLMDKGVDPSGGKMAIEQGDIGRERASADVGGITSGTSKVEDTKVAGLQNVVNMARGDASKSVEGLGSIAGNEVQRADQDAYYQQQSRNDNFEAGASLAGMGIAGMKGMKMSNSGVSAPASTSWGGTGDYSGSYGIASNPFPTQNKLPANELY